MFTHGYSKNKEISLFEFLFKLQVQFSFCVEIRNNYEV